jgi:hypothetical protein
MTNVAHLEYLERHVALLRTIIAGLVGLVVAGFSVGITWDRILSYKEKVDEEHTHIKAVQGEMKKQMDVFEKEISLLKNNLGTLSDPTYQVEAAEEEGRCETGRVVTGIRYKENRLWVRCASLGRAAWNPNPNPQGIASASDR